MDGREEDKKKALKAFNCGKWCENAEFRFHATRLCQHLTSRQGVVDIN